LVAGVRESDSLTAPGIAYIRTYHRKAAGVMLRQAALFVSIR